MLQRSFAGQAHDEQGWLLKKYASLPYADLVGSRDPLATVDDYVVQPYDGARWVALETPTDPEAALASYLALRRLNLVLYKRIPSDQRARPFPHPELGEISIDWILQTLAGHDLHHLRHWQAIGEIMTRRTARNSV